MQNDIDKGLTELVDEAAYFYARLVRSEHIDLLNELCTSNSEQARQEALTELVNSAGINSQYFVDVGWKDVNGFISVNGFESPSADFYSDAEKNKNSIVFGSVVGNCDTLGVYMINPLISYTGTFVFYMLESAINDIYSAADLGEYTFIMQSDGYIISHDDDSFLGKMLIYENLFSLYDDEYQYTQVDGDRKFVTVKAAVTVNSRYDFDFYIVSFMDYNEYYGAFDTMTYIYIAVASVIFIGGVVLAIVQSGRISKPLEQLNNSINEVIKTGKKSKETVKGGDEIYMLEKNYDEMMDRIFKLVQKSKEDMETQRKLELDSLQMQINPHFLYNALDAVVWMAKIKKEHDIENLVLNLAMFFRLSLHKGDKYITVAEEMEICRHYLEVQKIRFPKMFEAVFEIDESVAKYKTLKLLLQPLVENSVKYAFNEKPGHIYLKAYGDGEDIVFEVIDDGEGFEVKDDILTIKNDSRSPGGGYGIYNVNERIKLEYGEGYGLVITSEPGKGTHSTVRIKKKL